MYYFKLKFVRGRETAVLLEIVIFIPWDTLKKSCFFSKSVFIILQIVATYLEVPSASTRAEIMLKTNKQTNKNKTKEPNHSTPKASFVYFTVLEDLQGIQLFVCINDCMPLHIEPA